MYLIEIRSWRDCWRTHWEATQRQSW